MPKTTTDIIKLPNIGTAKITRNKASRSIKMRVSGYKNLAVTAPMGSSLSAVEHFILKNMAWVKNQDHWATPQFINGTQINPTQRLVISPSSTPKYFKSVSDSKLTIHLPSDAVIDSTEVQKYIYDSAMGLLDSSSRKALGPRALKLAQELGFEYKKLRYKNTTSRWGSFSSAGNLNLNIQLSRLEDELIDHVIVHELCHSKHLSHSKDFWALFSKLRPNFESEKKKLHQYRIWREPY